MAASVLLLRHIRARPDLLDALPLLDISRFALGLTFDKFQQLGLTRSSPQLANDDRGGRFWNGMYCPPILPRLPKMPIFNLMFGYSQLFFL